MQALAKKQADGSVRYLIEDKQIVYLTAADVMNVVQAPDEEKSTGGMVAFGNPTGADLPAAEAEVRAIAQVFPATEVFSGGDVTKVALNAEERLNKRSYISPPMEDSTRRLRRRVTSSSPPPARLTSSGSRWARSGTCR
jgi:CHAT domain-containing protein